MKKLKPSIMNIKHTFSRFFRLNNLKNTQKILWSDLKKYFEHASKAGANYKYGIFESEKYITTYYTIDKANNTRQYRYLLESENYRLVSLVFISEGYDEAKTTDVFILASHLNNILGEGIVRVNPDICTILFEHRINELVPFLFPGEIHTQVVRHYNHSLDIIWAFDQLLLHNQDPVFIAAELLKRNDERIKKKDSSEQKSSF